MSTDIGERNGVLVSRYAGHVDDAVVYRGESTRVRYQITDSAGDHSFLTLDPNQIEGLRQILALLDEAPATDPLADYVPVYLTDNGVTDEAAMLDRLLFLVGKLVNR
jgi:hypothetical protein